MANHCSVDMTVEGDREDVARFLKCLRGFAPFYGSFDCGGADAFAPFLPSGVVPLPVFREATCNALLPVPVGVMEKDYGKSGYEWCVSNWGNKWDIETIEWQNKEPTFLSGSWEGAWSGHAEWLKEVAGYFPGLSIQMAYLEEANEVAGLVTWNGAEVVHREFDGGTREYRQFALDYFGMEEEFDEVEGPDGREEGEGIGR